MSLNQNIFFETIFFLTIFNLCVSYLHMDHANIYNISSNFIGCPQKPFCQNIVYIWLEISYFVWDYKVFVWDIYIF